jgi:AraC-like DNA-binding protein
VGSLGRAAGDRSEGPAGLSEVFAGPAAAHASGGALLVSQTRLGALTIARLLARHGKVSFAAPPSVTGGGVALLLCIAGGGTLRQGAQELGLARGDLALIALDRPLEARLSGRFVLVRRPSVAIPARGGGPATRLCRPAAGDRALLALARSLLLSLARQARRLGPEDIAPVQAICLDLLVRLSDRPGPLPEPALPARIRDVIEAHLTDPDLTPARIAAACGTSVRGLHRHFVGARMSVCEWIRARRLERCREELEDPRWSGRTITEIAFRWGFNDAAHFSRAFKAHYGTSPRAVRAGVAA